MGSFPRFSLVLASVLSAAPLLVGCADVHEGQNHVEEVSPLLQQYALDPKPGTAVVFPPVPLSRRSEGMDADNLLSNPGFRFGRVDWSVRGAQAAVCTKTDLLCTDGQFSLQVLPSAGGGAFISQAVAAKPRTFYSFSAYVFAPGASEITLEVRDPAGIQLLGGEPLRGPLSAWSHVFLTFVTGLRTEEISVGIRCQDLDTNAPILIDQCALHILPATNFVESGTMETAPEEGRMAEWYLGGKSVSPIAQGYQSTHAVELPRPNDRASSLACLIPMRDQLEGRAVWISAAIRSVSPGDAPPPEVTLTLKTRDIKGEYVRTSATCPATGKWEEVTLLATMPEHGPEDTTDVPPFHVLLFERPAGVKGRVFIDEVIMLAVPEVRFDGGLMPVASSR